MGQSLGGIPICNLGLNNSAAFSTTLINAANVAHASMFLGETGHGAIVGAIYNVTAVTSPPVFQISLQGISSRGTPDGSIKSSGNANFTFTPTVNLFQANFTAPYTPAINDALSLVCAYSSGTVGASNNATFARTSGASVQPQTPYAALETAGTWAVSTGTPCLAPIYNDGYIGRNFFPAKTLVNNTTSNNYYGTYWIPTYAATFSGCMSLIRPPASGSSLNFTLYEGSSTTIGGAGAQAVSTSGTISPDLSFEDTGGAVPTFIPMPAYTLKAGIVYRLVMQNTGTALTTFAYGSFTTQSAFQSAAGPLTGGTIGSSGSFSDFISGGDIRLFGIAPCIDTLSTSFSYGGAG